MRERYYSPSKKDFATALSESYLNIDQSWKVWFWSSGNFWASNRPRPHKQFSLRECFAPFSQRECFAPFSHSSKLAAGGKPSTRFPPGGLVELIYKIRIFKLFSTNTLYLLQCKKVNFMKCINRGRARNSSFRIRLELSLCIQNFFRIRPNSKASRGKPRPQKHATEIIAMQTM